MYAFQENVTEESLNFYLFMLSCILYACEYKTWSTMYDLSCVCGILYFKMLHSDKIKLPNTDLRFYVTQSLFFFTCPAAAKEKVWGKVRRRTI